MATAQDIVTRAFRALTAIDINEQPTPNEAQAGLDILTAMIAAWATRNWAVTDVTLPGTTALGSATVTGLDTSQLARGLNVSGAGIPAGTRIKSVDDRCGRVTLTANATAAGTVALTFTLLPFETRHEQGVTALLAMQLAPQVGIDAIPAVVALNARQGEAALRAQFFKLGRSRFDLPRQETIELLDGEATG